MRLIICAKMHDPYHPLIVVECAVSNFSYIPVADCGADAGDVAIDMTTGSDVEGVDFSYQEVQDGAPSSHDHGICIILVIKMTNNYQVGFFSLPPLLALTSNTRSRAWHHEKQLLMGGH